MRARFNQGRCIAPGLDLLPLIWRPRTSSIASAQQLASQSDSEIRVAGMTQAGSRGQWGCAPRPSELSRLLTWMCRVCCGRVMQAAPAAGRRSQDESCHPSPRSQDARDAWRGCPAPFRSAV